MALPKLNVTPRFELTIPSTGKKVRFRSYLVKEEKLLLLAMESKDVSQMVSAMIDTIEACAEDELNIKRLTTFDVEYLFTQIRAKSVGEVIKLNLICKECDHRTEVPINIENVVVNVPKVDKIIVLTPEISIEMKYPSYMDVMKSDFLEGLEKGDKQTTAMFEMTIKCINAILTPDERFSADDSTDEELMDFVESLTTDQFSKLTVFMQSMPELVSETDFVCEKCGAENHIKLKGMADFF